MAAESDSVWAIEIGNSRLKALRLRLAGETIDVIGFDNIEHEKILSSGNIKDNERSELVRASLRRFVSKNNLGKDEVIVSVPSQSSFARFIKLPPVEPKRIPEIVRFEAVQQIPFDINEVEWDWQVMKKADSTNTEVGIFAVNNEIVNEMLEHFRLENMKVTCVQMAAMALCNYVFYDRSEIGDSDKKAVLALDIGTVSSDLVICTASKVWQRCIPLGGNSFTTAIADAFKLSFEKAEKLKRTAPLSKYAKQIFQAMKPVFTDFAAELQRSIGFYNSSNRNVKFQKVIALGGGMKLRGLTKYLQQTVQIPFVRPDSFNKLGMGTDVSAPKFTENVADFGVVYGLAVQGLGVGRIETNLLPRRIARTMAWARKARYLTAAVCVLVIVSLMCFARSAFDRSKFNSRTSEIHRQKIQNVVSDAESAINQLAQQRMKDSKYAAVIDKEFGYFKYRETIALLNKTVLSCLPNAENNRDQAELYKAFASGDVSTVKRFPRKQRKQLFVTGMSVHYAEDIAKEQFVTHKKKERGVFRRFDQGGPESIGPEGINPFNPFGGPMMRARQQVRKQPGRTKPVTGKSRRGRGKKGTDGKSGFVVVIEGYSPYEKIYDLIDPVGVDDNKSQWGIVTRLMHLKEFFENCPFELYEKDKPEHFKVDTDVVEFGGAGMPDGIGLLKPIKSQARQEAGSAKGLGFRQQDVLGRRRQKGSSKILIDPMTKEIISRVAARDADGAVMLDEFGKEIYNDNDHWFRIKAKFLWKDVSKQESEKEEKKEERGARSKETGVRKKKK